MTKGQFFSFSPSLWITTCESQVVTYLLHWKYPLIHRIIIILHFFSFSSDNHRSGSGRAPVADQVLCTRRRRGRETMCRSELWQVASSPQKTGASLLGFTSRNQDWVLPRRDLHLVEEGLHLVYNVYNVYLVYKNKANNFCPSLLSKKCWQLFYVNNYL